MIWPFKKREPAMPFAEFVKTLDPAPCGEQEKHYQWTLGSSMPCPCCLAIAQHKRKDAELDLLADKIVERLSRTRGVSVAPSHTESPQTPMVSGDSEANKEKG